MPSTQLVSVVVPAHNRAATIASCLESVRQQTHGRWEVIVVDDGSDDDTAGIVQTMASSDARLRLLRHERNRGAQAARNTGARAARGDWIAFLDSDDQFTPRSLELRLARASACKVEVVHSDCDVLTPDGGRSRFGVRPISGRVHRELLFGQGPLFPGMLVTRRALERIGYLDEDVVAFQEWDTAIRLARECEFAFVPETTFVYDCRRSDSISRDLLRTAIGYEQVFRKHRSAMLQTAGPAALARHYYMLASLYGQARGIRKACIYWLLAALWGPFRLPELLSRMSERVQQRP